MLTATPALVILTPGFADGEADTACIPPQQVFIRNLKKVFPALQVFIIAFHYPYTPKEYDWFQCHVISLGGKNQKGLMRLWLWYRAWQVLKKIHRQYAVTGLLSFWCGECAWCGKRFSRKYRLKHYIWIWGQDAKKENVYVNRIQPRSSDLIALSDFISREFHKNHGMVPAQTIYPGIDPDLFSKNEVEKDIDVLAAGSLIPLKRFDVFINIVRKLKNTMPHIKAVLAGKGPEGTRIKTMINEWDLTENILLAGGLPHTEVLHLMQRAKVFLHSSSFEGFGYVCLEALHAGCRVISFIRPVKEDIPGWIIVKTEEEMAAAALQILKCDSPGYKSHTAFLMEDTVKAVLQLYNYTAPATA